MTTKANCLLGTRNKTHISCCKFEGGEDVVTEEGEMEEEEMEEVAMEDGDMEEE